MVISLDKSRAIWFCRDPQVPLLFGGSPLVTAQSVKFLGVWLDTKLKFTYHVEKSIEKGYKKLGQVQRLHKIPFTFSGMYVQAVIVPTIFFANVVWIWGISQTTGAKMDQLIRQCFLKLTGCFKTSFQAALYLLTGCLSSQWQAFLMALRCFICFHRKDIKINQNQRRNTYRTRLHGGFDTILDQSEVSQGQLEILRNDIINWSPTSGSMEQAILKKQYSNLQDWVTP